MTGAQSFGWGRKSKAFILHIRGSAFKPDPAMTAAR